MPTSPERNNFMFVRDRQNEVSRLYMNLNKATPNALRGILIAQIMNREPRDIIMIKDRRKTIFPFEEMIKAKEYFKEDKSLAIGEIIIRERFFSSICKSMKEADQVVIQTAMSRFPLRTAFKDFINNSPSLDPDRPISTLPNYAKKFIENDLSLPGVLDNL